MSLLGRIVCVSLGAGFVCALIMLPIIYSYALANGPAWLIDPVTKQSEALGFTCSMVGIACAVLGALFIVLGVIPYKEGKS